MCLIKHFIIIIKSAHSSNAVEQACCVGSIIRPVSAIRIGSTLIGGVRHRQIVAIVTTDSRRTWAGHRVDVVAHASNITSTWLRSAAAKKIGRALTHSWTWFWATHTEPRRSVMVLSTISHGSSPGRTPLDKPTVVVVIGVFVHIDRQSHNTVRGAMKLSFEN